MKFTKSDHGSSLKGQNTSGDLSPNIARDLNGSFVGGDVSGPYVGGNLTGTFVGRDYITFANDVDKTQVKFKSPKTSVVTEKRSLFATITASLGTIASGIKSYKTVVDFFQFDLNLRSIFDKDFFSRIFDEYFPLGGCLRFFCLLFLSGWDFTPGGAIKSGLRLEVNLVFGNLCIQVLTGKVL